MLSASWCGRARGCTRAYAGAATAGRLPTNVRAVSRSKRRAAHYIHLSFGY
ncbi:hypothetical protein BVI1335_220005 [Burkholderia vietnamiensis]|nr:hypothetical protein BVI1335_220005 [Burkholderia vietnamiensis]